MAVLGWRRKQDAGRDTVRADAELRAQFEALALPLLPALYNTARWLTRDAVEAEDLVQETMVKALGGFAGFEVGTNFKAWSFRILRNTWLTSRSGLAARRTVALEEELEAGGMPEAIVERATPEVELMRLSDRAALESAMQQLPAPLLEVVLLCDVEEMKYREIAAVLEVPIGTVMSRVSRARAALRENLAQQGAEKARVREGETLR
jgi:RNA polymerase sigma-70 factor (ECF subfamily)